MPADFTWHKVLEDWANAVQPFAQIVVENGVFARDGYSRFEYPELNDKLQRATLQEIDASPIDSFGVIGDAICVMETEAAAWLLPILLRFGSVSQEDIYARSVINVLRQRISKLATWPDIKRIILPVTRDRLYALALLCCELGWQHDEKRVIKRTAECKDIFF
jgi:hypothetical protein